MKKDIMALLKSENGTYRLNNISYLKRWTIDGLGNNVDCLTIEFDNINNVNYGYSSYNIFSRDYDGIIAECEKATNKYLTEVTNRLTTDLRAGFRGSRKGI
jgi:hypothetical protein